ncbi:hypothetical protein KSS87_004918 [Heliosperma pusillum]|nr:hypothetical protein KSS87_004918 [Heliosperma pusillum]
MDVRVGLLVLLALAGNWVSDARDIADLKVSGVEEAVRRIDLCAVCEEYVTVALNYLNDDKTHEEIMMALHDSCSQMRNLADQCTVMVDRYAALFFTDVSSVQPEGFCKEVGLCKNAMVSSLPAKRNKCELDIIEKLLKACNSVGDKYKTKCKKMVFEFGPVLLVDAGSFVEKLDLCTTFHACTRHPAKIEGMIEMVTSS